MRARGLVVIACLLVVSVSAGCAAPDAVPDNETPSDGTDGDTNAPRRNVTLAGRVVDARAGTAVPEATVRVELVTGHPCRAESTRLAWASWSPTVHANGTFGPLTVPAPVGNASFQFHVDAPGHVSTDREVLYPATGEGADAAEGHLADVRLALTPAGTVAFEAPEAGLLAWWVAGAPGAYLAGFRVPAITTAAGPVRGVLTNESGGLTSWRADVPVGGNVTAELAPAPPHANATRVIVTVTDVAGDAVRGAFVLALDDTAGDAAALAVTDADGRAVVDVPTGGPVTLHAVRGGPVPTRAAASFVADTDAAEPTLTLRSPACPGTG